MADPGGVLWAHKNPPFTHRTIENGCGLVKSGRVLGKIDEKNPPCESSGSAPGSSY